MRRRVIPPRDVAGDGERLAVVTSSRMYYTYSGETRELVSTPGNLFLYDVKGDTPVWNGAASLTTSIVEGYATRVAVKGGVAYVAVAKKGIQVVDLEMVPTDGDAQDGDQTFVVRQHLITDGETAMTITVGVSCTETAVITYRFGISRAEIDSIKTAYATNEVGFTSTQTQLLLLVSILFAVVGGMAWGVLVDRIGPKRTLNIVLLIWVFALSAIVAISVFDLSKWFFWAVATLAGVALGGVWAADRPYMLRLAPPRFVGEFYGLYARVGRFASIIGPFMWGYIVDTLGLGRPAAVASLLVFIVLAFVVLQGVDDRPREWPAELL
jgi:hypothetical protein